MCDTSPPPFESDYTASRERDAGERLNSSFFRPRLTYAFFLHLLSFALENLQAGGGSWTLTDTLGTPSTSPIPLPPLFFRPFS